MAKRNTPTKQLILESLKSSKSALNQEILQKKLGDSIDRATIYRVLNSFCEDGLIHKILGDDGKFYFAVCINCTESKHQHNHFHFKCLNCGTVECLPNEMDIQLPKNYRSVNFNGLITGFCGNCEMH